MLHIEYSILFAVIHSWITKDRLEVFYRARAVKSDTCTGKSRTDLRHKHRRKELANIAQIHASLFYSVREETMDTD